VKIIDKMNNKDIVIVGPAYPIRGGNALFIGHLYELLSSKFDISVISFSKLYPKLLFPGVRQVDISKQGMKPHPAEHIINSVNFITWQKALHRIVELSPKVLALNWWQPFFGPLMCYLARRYKKKNPNAKIVFLTENVVSHESRFIDKFLTGMALRRAEYFITLSKTVELEIQSEYPDKPLWRAALPIYDCYEPPEHISKDDAKEQLKLTHKKIILFFGYVRKYKGLDNLINAMPKILKSVPEAHLLIVGEFYDSPDHYINLINSNNIEQHTTIINEYVPNEEVGKYYAAADIVALPYNTATQSGILNIAFGFKKPVIVTDVGGLTETVEENINGLIVPAGDINALSDGIIRFYNEGLFEKMTKQMQNYTIKNDFELILDAFEEILH
jgi:glycosyltransferase involved in cell wall biosynthesis